MFAKDIASKPVIHVGPETPVSEVAALLADQRISGVPVSEDRRLVARYFNEASPRIAQTKKSMPPNLTTPTPLNSLSDRAMSRLLGSMSIFTMLMTIPQVLSIWIGHQAAGVSLLSWGAYLISAVLWFWHGLRTRDKNIYLACVGWVLLDSAVIAGVIVYG